MQRVLSRQAHELYRGCHSHDGTIDRLGLGSFPAPFVRAKSEIGHDECSQPDTGNDHSRECHLVASPVGTKSSALKLIPRCFAAFKRMTAYFIGTIPFVP